MATASVSHRVQFILKNAASAFNVNDHRIEHIDLATEHICYVVTELSLFYTYTCCEVGEVWRQILLHYLLFD